MKYNIKIKKILFLSLVAVIFCLPVGKVLAVTVCGDLETGSEGTCEYGECSKGVMKLNSNLCESNILDKTCCANEISVITDSTSNCSSSNGKMGMCEFGECSAGLSPIQSTDCWFGRNCCALTSSNVQTATSNSNLNLNTNNNSNSSTNNNLNSNNQISTGNDLGCCSTNCSTNKSGCASENWYENVSCFEVPSCKAYSSQCSITNSDGTQSGCTNLNDSDILNSQCKAIYKGEESVCSNMQSYLNKMGSECKSLKNAGSLGTQGINCDAIANGGFYGNEASKFSNYLISGSSNGASTGNSNRGTSGAGGLDFDSIAATGIPDSPNVKVVLVNIVKWMLEILGLITFIAFIISGGQYLMSAGDETAMQKAKKNMTYSIIGIIVALSGFVIIRAIDTALRATSSMF